MFCSGHHATLYVSVAASFTIHMYMNCMVMGVEVGEAQDLVFCHTLCGDVASIFRKYIILFSQSEAVTSKHFVP